MTSSGDSENWPWSRRLRLISLLLFFAVGIYIVITVLLTILSSLAIPIGANSFFICFVGMGGFVVRVRAGQLEDEERQRRDDAESSSPPE